MTMGTTSGERRDVAEDLRHMNRYGRICYKEQFFDDLAETVVGFEEYHDFGTVIEKLADLIDPTCVVRMPLIGSVGVCSRCGALVETRSAVFSATEALPTRYCPNCGARVVNCHE